jgi:uncharacterized protein
MSAGHEAPLLLTASGRAFPLLGPTRADIDFGVVGEALAKQCRFAGHTAQFYSVAQHSIPVAELLPSELRLYGLLHDAHAAFLGDITGPAKRAIELRAGPDMLRRISDEIDAAIFAAAGLLWPMQPAIAAAVTQADRIALATELRDLVPQGQRAFGPLPPPLRRVLRPMPWASAMEAFHLRFHDYARWHVVPRTD